MFIKHQPKKDYNKNHIFTEAVELSYKQDICSTERGPEQNTGKECTNGDAVVHITVPCKRLQEVYLYLIFENR